MGKRVSVLVEPAASTEATCYSFLYSTYCMWIDAMDRPPHDHHKYDQKGD